MEKFFLELDKQWKTLGEEPIQLSIIGSTALFLQSDYQRGTKDTDFLEIDEISENAFKAILKLGGKGSPLSKKFRLFIEIVKRPIPFLPVKPNFVILTHLNKKLKNFRVEVLEIVDVLVSKLKPYRPQDLEDIREMINRNLVDPDKFSKRFLLAKERWLMDARAHELKSYIENFHEVQRELLGVLETPIELPAWLDHC